MTVSAYLGQAIRNGWCNGCTERPPYRGGEIAVFQFGASQVRLCPACSERTQELLAQVGQQRVAAQRVLERRR